MNENELKSLEVYNEKFKEDPTSFNDFQANDYIKLLKKSDNNEDAIEVGKTFMSQCPNLKGYLNQYGYALYNKYINIDDAKIQENENLFFSVLDDILAVCKQERYSPMEPAVNRAIKYLQRVKPNDPNKLIEVLNLLDPNLLDDTPFTNPEGKEFESKKERYYRLKVKALYEAKRSKECVETANIALTLPIKWHFNTLQWINYQRACSLVELERYDEAKKIFLQLHNHIRSIDFYEVIYKTLSKTGNIKEANAYLLYEFFENGYSIDHLGIYQRLLEATLRTEDPMLIEIVDIFLTKLCQENNRDYTPQGDYGDKYNDQTSEYLYDEVYEKVMNNLDKYVERVEGTVVHYNKDRGIGTISRYDNDGIFFRQADYVYDEDVQRRDKVEYTPLETFDRKKNVVTSKAILIITTEEYINFGY
ncbi:hypothetical protein [uncultured Thomasclavelia sp.]|uniref:hypothetical protein n=1 Tax=uncultured Thomasclavelia sp. TaxID=3025759 RepID=UPI0025EC842F|nr:hypothetical protein [uncultured Thomasclavelia sp.]